MLRKYTALALSLALALCLCACGTKDQTPSPTADQAANATWGTLDSDTTTIGPSASSGSVVEASPLPTAQGSSAASTVGDSVDYTKEAIQALMLCDYQDGLTYNSQDPVYFWRAVGYLIALAGPYSPAASVDEAAGTITMVDTNVTQFAAALFLDFSGQAADMPAVTEEDPLVSCEYGADGNTYHFALGDYGNLHFDISDPLPLEGGGYASAAVLTVDDAPTNYTVTLQDSTYDSGKPLFRYSISDFTKNET